MKKLLIAASLAATCLNANAEGGYIGLGYGQGKVTFDSVDVSPATLTEDNKASSYKIFGGYEFNKNFAVEGGYQEFGAFSQTVTFGASTAKAEFKGSAFFVDLVGKLPVNDNFSFFGKIGFAQTKLQAKVTASGIFAGCCSDESASETNPRFGIGAQYDFTRQAGVRFEFERTTNVGKEDTTGEGDVDYMGIGLTFKF